MSESRVRQFYSGKSLFITGGTGFVGICLIEKLLRSVPDVGRLYLLVRRKKGKEVDQRMQDIASNPIFEKLLEKSSPDIFKKITLVAGDVGEENLGLSDQDRRMLTENIDVVVHSAATLDFQERLRPTINVNLLGTRRVTELCGQCKHLKALVHVSSAYVNAYLKECHERVYDAPADAEYVIGLLDKMDDEALLELEPKLLGDHPNTYTFTKHLAEHEVKKCADLFPCTIVRPSMIVAAWKEPVPGWTMSKVGPQGFMMGAGKGVIRRLITVTENIQDYIPVDVVVNEILVAGYHAATTKSGLTVYHVTSSTTRPFRWAMVEPRINKILCEYPQKGAIWYPHLRFTSSVFMFRLSAILYHFMPALFFDTILRLTGGRPILMRLHKNVWTSVNLLLKFIYGEWIFHNPNTKDLNASLSAADKDIFYIDISTIDWVDYFTSLLLGVRRYLCKERIENLESARGKNTVLLCLHLAAQAVRLGALWYAVAWTLGTTMTKCAWVAPAIYMLLGLL